MLTGLINGPMKSTARPVASGELAHSDAVFSGSRASKVQQNSLGLDDLRSSRKNIHLSEVSPDSGWRKQKDSEDRADAAH